MCVYYRAAAIRLVLQVDETGVMELHTLNPSTQTLESYRYPLVDTKNATSVLKLLEITVDDTNKVGVAISRSGWISQLQISTKIKSLSYSFTHLWSDYEYLVRCGWLPDGKR